MEDFDYEELRKDLMNYYGGATFMFGQAYMNVIKAENASNEELIQMGIESGFNLSVYERENRRELK